MNNVRFLKLHTAADNSPLIVRDNLIVSAYRSDNGTVINFYEGDMSSELNVKETPERIISMTDEGFVKLHFRDDNKTVCINVDYIKNVFNTEKSSGGTQVNMLDLEFVVNETPEKVYNLLQRAVNRDVQSPEAKKETVTK